MWRGRTGCTMSWRQQVPPPRRGENPAYNLPDIALIDMGDFVGGMVKYLRRHPLANLSIMGGFGKMVKLGQGAIDLHSARSQVDFNRIGSDGSALGLDTDKVAAANSVLEVAQMANPEQRDALAQKVATAARATVIASA